MRMRTNVCSCLLLFVLGCNVNAAIKHEIVEEKTSVILKCPRSVEGRVTWSRERDGHRVQILTTDGDRDKKHIPDSSHRYSSLADKSLHIRRVNVSDTGRHFCNDEAAVELTVIPSGTPRQFVTERSRVTLSCPPDVGGSDVPMWSREKGEIKQRRFRVSPKNRTLTIRDLQLGDSGLYYCGGKPVVYLNVTTAETSEGGNRPSPTTTPRNADPTTEPGGVGGKNEGEKTAPPAPAPPPTSPPAKPPTVPAPVTNTEGDTTTTTTTTSTATTTATKQNPPETSATATSSHGTTVTPTEQHLPLRLVLGIAAPLLLLNIIIIFTTIMYFTRRCRSKRTGSRTAGNSGTGGEIGLYENCSPVSAGEDSTYESLDPSTRDQDQTYSTITGTQHA